MRECNICQAYFKKENDSESLYYIRKHLENCTEDSPFLNDKDADGYLDY